MATDGKRRELPIELVERRAYELYLERGGEDGRDLEDWVRAEEEITTQMEAKQRTEHVESKSSEPKRSAEAIASRAEDRDTAKSFTSTPLTKQAGR